MQIVSRLFYHTFLLRAHASKRANGWRSGWRRSDWPSDRFFLVPSAPRENVRVALRAGLQGAPAVAG